MGGQEFLLGSITCYLRFGGGFVGRKLNRSQVEGIGIEGWLRYIHHDIMAG
jgi:hypothetical protein